MKTKVTVFEQYQFVPGQKIRIEKSKRAGDWEVVGVTDRKVTLKCPISGKEFTWDAFCYRVSDEECRWPRE